jgi:competence protein ComEC
MDDLLQQGITAYRKGHRKEARLLLAGFLKQNINNEDAWSWFYMVCDNDQERKDCLLQIIRINPHNSRAIELLRRMTSPGQTPQSPEPEDNPAEAPKGNWLSRKVGRLWQSLEDGSFSQYIIHHPLVFVLDVLLIAGLCFGGLFLIPGRLKPKTVPATAAPASPTASREAPATSLPTIIAAPIEIQPTLQPEATDTAVTISPAGTGFTGTLVVTFIDVGLGDSILISAPDGQTGLIDGGSAGKGALAYLQEQGIQKIDLMVATHADEEHIGGLVEVLNAMPVERVFTSGQADTTPVYAQFLDAIAADKAEYAQAVNGDTLNLGSLAFSVFSPAGSDRESSLELRLSYGKMAFLFMGDSDAPAEEAILAAGQDAQADILKVGRHTTCAASSPAFLDAVHPLVAIYSPGEDNPGDYPCQATLDELNGRGVFVFSTDAGGPIQVSITAEGYSLSNLTGVLFRK